MENGQVLQVKNLTKIYRSRRQGEVKAVDNISFSVKKNEVVGLLGPNGAGKTTIKCICTILRPTSGEIWIDGADAIKNPRAALERVTAVLEGNRNIYWRLNVRDNLEFFAGLQGQSSRSVHSQIDELIEMFNLKEKVNAQARTLSRGMQQKLAVACALVRNTPILLLDEPTLGLDVETSYELRWILKRMADEGKRTIVLSSHDMNVVQDICERVIIINQGRVVVDDQIENLKKLFQASSYRFEIDGQMNGSLETQLQQKFDLVKISKNGQKTVIEAEMLEGIRVYEIIDVLKNNGCQLESVGRQYPNLEEIFLKIVKGEKK
ncbi:ABC transporter ATP-binding protein [Candidatus Acetothermia bacterium]|nr:ABC transporter ATP-binding protein [Candidatus Acetothermia bacterium]MBI3459691.1 ABC transporter ATP-binding protein [Candidatus Acetothermia bacterium]